MKRTESEKSLEELGKKINDNLIIIHSVDSVKKIETQVNTSAQRPKEKLSPVKPKEKSKVVPKKKVMKIGILSHQTKEETSHNSYNDN